MAPEPNRPAARQSSRRRPRDPAAPAAVGAPAEPAATGSPAKPPAVPAPEVPPEPASRPAAEPAGRAAATRQALANVYAGLLTAAELTELAGAADGDLEDEVVLLRALVRRAVAEGDRMGAARIVQALAATLRVQQGLGSRTRRQVDQALARMLDEIGRDFPPPG